MALNMHDSCNLRYTHHSTFRSPKLGFRADHVNPGFWSWQMCGWSEFWGNLGSKRKWKCDSLCHPPFFKGQHNMIRQ